MVLSFNRLIVNDLVLNPICTVDRFETIEGAISKMKLADTEVVVVLNQNGQADGIITVWQLLTLVQGKTVTWHSSLAEFQPEPIIICRLTDLIDEYKLISVQRFLVVDENNCPIGLVHGEKALNNFYKRTNVLLHTIIDFLPCAVVGVDLLHRITVFNPAASDLTGISLDLVSGAHIQDVIPNTRLPQVSSSGEEELNGKICIGDKLLATSRFPIKFEGNVIGAGAILQDISVAEATSHKLNLIEELNIELNNIVELSADGLVVSDGNGILLHINRAYEQIVGVKAKAFLGKSVNELKLSGILPDAVTLHVLQSHRQENLYLQLRGRDVLLTGQPIFDDQGQLIRVVATIRDLTELNMLKEQVQTFRELSDRYLAELAELRARETEIDFISEGLAMRRVVDLCRKVAHVDTNILVTGESGTGKELVTKFIHRASLRNDGPFVAINCGAIPVTLLESELFGYDEGAFSGAKRSGKPGLFETAKGGTIFLDEIAEMPSDLQVKLLRVIQERSFYRVGGNKLITMDARIIAATNKHLPKMISEGLFREDLFYRLNVIQIVVPPLRERREEIPTLIMYFLDRFNKKYQFQQRISPETISRLVNHDWPGNVRELENAIERMVVLSAGDSLDHGFLTDNAQGESFRIDQRSLRIALEEVERDLVISTYRKCKSTRVAARQLGISQPSVVRKLQRFGYDFSSGS